MRSPLVILLFAVATVYAEPSPPSDVVFKPTFLTGYDSLTAGTGFVTRINGDAVFLTAHHLFGPAAGLERDLSPVEAKKFVAALAGSSMTRESFVIVSSEMILIASAKAFDQRDAGRDVAAFNLPNYSGPTLPMATAAPKPGEKVYLYARPRGEERLRLVSAVVSRVRPDALEYFYETAGVNLAGTSGAPVLNEMGEVVALNLGGGDVNGRAFGFGNPATSFVALVTNANAGRHQLEVK